MNKHLKRNPHKIRGTNNAWWYEEANGIVVIVEGDAIKEGYGGTASISIPWKLIRAALNRKDRK